jgi:UDP-2-acetamido-2,6-beta-L-arabino-hexul-4-ose reductase
MNILVTGAKGFVGKNFCTELENIRDGKVKKNSLTNDINIMEYDLDTDSSLLDDYCKIADFVFNLAGVNRPENPSEFMTGNLGFASVLLDTLKKYNNTCPVMLSSSIQATLDNPYGKSKKAGEDLFFQYSKKTGARVLVYRFPNLFGKWCKPNYNSVVATFCNNIAHDLPIIVNDPGVVMKLVYIDDVVAEFIDALSGKEHKIGDFCVVPTVHTIELGKIVELIETFKSSSPDLSIPNMGDDFTKKLFATYLTYLPDEKSFSK